MSNETMAHEREESERLRFLPPPEQMADDFRYLLTDDTNKTMRLIQAADYSRHIRSSLGFPLFGEITLDEAKRQNESRIFLSAVSVIAQDGILKGEGIERQPKRKIIRDVKEVIGAKRELQSHVEDYVLFNFEREDMGLFRDLENIVARARQVTYGDAEPSLPYHWRGSGLLGLLAESKIVYALKQEWPGATHASVEQDIRGVDVVVPTPGKSTGLQVKCVPQAKSTLKIEESDTSVPKVFVPMNPKFNNPFKLNADDTERIMAYIRSSVESGDRKAA